MRQVLFLFTGLLGLFGLVSLESCRPMYRYEYTISNHTDTTVLVRSSISYYADTLIWLESGQDVTLYAGKRSEEKRGGPFYHSVNEDLDSFFVWQGNALSRKDYRNDSVWLFTKKDYKGNFYAEINQTEF